jgi:hypothetical protein
VRLSRAVRHNVRQRVREKGSIEIRQKRWALQSCWRATRACSRFDPHSPEYPHERGSLANAGKDGDLISELGPSRESDQALQLEGHAAGLLLQCRLYQPALTATHVGDSQIG